MSFMDFFSTHDVQDQRQRGSTSSEGMSQSNAWPQFSGYLNDYAAMRNPAAFNQSQYQALGQLGGAASYLQPGAWTAGNIATGGLDTNDISRFYNQNTQAMVDPLKRSFEYDRGKQLSEASGQAARTGNWGSSGGATLRAQTDEAIHRAQDPIVAKAYYDAQKSAVDAAIANQGQRIQASGLGANFTGAASNAGQGFAQQANWMQQQPLNWWTQWSSSLAPYLQAAGQKTSSQGQTDMVGTSTTAHQPSPFDIAAGAGSLAMGMPFGFAEGGSVEAGKKPGGHPHPDFADKVGHAFRSFHKLRKAAEGGIVDDGTPEFQVNDSRDMAGPGEMGPSLGMPSEASWHNGTSVDPAPIGKGWGQSISNGLSRWSQQMKPPQPGQPQGQDPFASLKEATARLRQLSTDAVPRAASGGEIHGYADGDMVTPEGPGGGFALSDYLPGIPKLNLNPTEGMWAGKAPTPRERIALSLGAMGSDRSPFKGWSANMMAQRQADLHQQQIDQAADIALGKIKGQPTLAYQTAQGVVGGKPTVAQQHTNLEAARNPAQIASLAAHAEEAQKRIAEFKTKQEKDLAALQFLQKAEQDIDNNVQFKVYTPEEGELRRTHARELYERMRRNIQEVNTPPAPNVTPPPNTTGTWRPGTGFTPNTP